MTAVFAEEAGVFIIETAIPKAETDPSMALTAVK